MVVYERQRLGADDAVERLRRDLLRTRQIRVDRGARVVGVDVEDLDRLERRGVGEAARVPVLLDLEHATAEVSPTPAARVAFEEALDVVAVYRRAAVPARVLADRPQPPEVPQAHTTHG